MGKAGEPHIRPADKDDYTSIVFEPDLAKFKMTTLDNDTVALFTRRAYDIAASTAGVKVWLNGKRLPVITENSNILFVLSKLLCRQA